MSLNIHLLAHDCLCVAQVAVERVWYGIEPCLDPEDPVELQDVAGVVARLEPAKVSHGAGELAVVRWLSKKLVQPAVERLVVQESLGRLPGHEHGGELGVQHDRRKAMEVGACIQRVLHVC